MTAVFAEQPLAYPGLPILAPEYLKQSLCLIDSNLNKQQNCNNFHALRAYGQTVQVQDGLQMANHPFSATITLTSQAAQSLS